MFNVIALPGFRVADAKLTLTSVLANLVTTGELVLTCRKDTDVPVLLVTVVSIAKKKNQTVEMIHAQNAPCAKMNQDTIISLAYADQDTLELTVT